MSRRYRPRKNWRDIPVTELRDCEVALMTREDRRWCHSLLMERAAKLGASK